MKILLLSRDLPSPYTGSALRIFNLLKYLSKKHEHNITLVALKERTKESKYVHDLRRYCDVIETIEMPEGGLSLKMVIYVIKNTLSLRNIFSKNHGFLNSRYSPKMQRKVMEMLKTSDFDLIFVDHLYMACYVLDMNLPKVVDVKDAMIKTIYGSYAHEKKFFKKIYWLMRYYITKRYEKKVYKKKFDMWIMVTPYDRDILRAYLPNLNISVIPNGVDTDYFKPMPIEQDFPSLIFVGDMGSQPNVAAVIYFYNEIYSLIKERVTNIKLYIVGRHPPGEISQLASDNSVIITGYVKDVRPYLARASVVVTPMIFGMGIKNKILEAMAMGKPVISTSIGARGIDVSPGENIIIADEPKEFANRVVELLEDEQLRLKIVHNGRRLVESNYSWEKMADMLNDVFEGIVKRK